MLNKKNHQNVLEKFVHPYIISDKNHENLKKKKKKFREVREKSGSFFSGHL